MLSTGLCGSVTGFTNHADGTVWLSDGKQLDHVSLNGTKTKVVNLTPPGSYKGLTFHQGKLYGIDLQGYQLVTINTTSGNITAIGKLSAFQLHALASPTP